MHPLCIPRWSCHEQRYICKMEILQIGCHYTILAKNEVWIYSVEFCLTSTDGAVFTLHQCSGKGASKKKAGDWKSEWVAAIPSSSLSSSFKAEAVRNHPFLYDWKSETSFRHAPVFSANQCGPPLTAPADPCPSSRLSTPSGTAPKAESTVKMKEPGRPCQITPTHHPGQTLCPATATSCAFLHQVLELASAHLWLSRTTTNRTWTWTYLGNSLLCAWGTDPLPSQGIFRSLKRSWRRAMRRFPHSTTSLHTGETHSLLTFSLPNICRNQTAAAMWFCLGEDRRWVLSSLEMYFSFF